MITPGGRQLVVGDFGYGWLVDRQAGIIVGYHMIMIDFHVRGPEST